jgi:hypothetical protein
MNFKKPDIEEHSLIDRFAVAFLSGLLTFVTSVVIWLFLAGINVVGESIIILPFKWVHGFTLLMAILGFLKLENFLEKIYGWVWKAIYRVFIF